MAEKKDSRHRTLTEARKAANKRYIDKFVPPSSTERLMRQWLATKNQRRNNDNRSYNEQGSRDLIPDCLFFLNHLKMYKRVLDGFSLILRTLRNPVPLRLRKIIIDSLHNSAFSFDLGDIKV